MLYHTLTFTPTEDLQMQVILEGNDVHLLYDALRSIEDNEAAFIFVDGENVIFNGEDLYKERYPVDVKVNYLDIKYYFFAKITLGTRPAINNGANLAAMAMIDWFINDGH